MLSRQLKSTDGRASEWISGDNNALSNWTIHDEDSDFVYLQMQLVDPKPFTEIENRAQDSILYHAINKVSIFSRSALSLHRPYVD